ncbi:MAG TPA: TIGR03619 family F420-dependent LLM class oxidoreductase [Myxococcota bacterium]|nr:TIGR03619 family F420-dependent LLM class oxidoreductase [Myxococcota bacterium]
MKLGIALRNMGPQSEPEVLFACARAAEEAGLDDLWVADHLAIPPDDAEGSNGRYLDPLATLATLSGVTRRIGLGTAVLNLPYRPALPTAKWVATIQELSGGRLRLGVGLGWMEPEFRALGVPRAERGRRADQVLELLRRCFAGDEIVENGQPFLFRPRPPAPPILVGGGPPHALARAVRFGDGWMPIGVDPGQLAGPIAELARRAREAGRTPLEVVCMVPTRGDEPADETAAKLRALRDVGVTHAIAALGRYPDAGAYRRVAESLGGAVRARLAQ